MVRRVAKECGVGVRSVEKVRMWIVGCSGSSRGGRGGRGGWRMERRGRRRTGRESLVRISGVGRGVVGAGKRRALLVRVISKTGMSSY